MTDLNTLTIADARDALKKGDVTSVELTEACIAQIDKADALGAFVHKTPEIALEQAKAADARGKDRLTVARDRLKCVQSTVGTPPDPYASPIDDGSSLRVRCEKERSGAHVDVLSSAARHAPVAQPKVGAVSAARAEERGGSPGALRTC